MVDTQEIVRKEVRAGESNLLRKLGVGCFFVMDGIKELVIYHQRSETRTLCRASGKDCIALGVYKWRHYDPLYTNSFKQWGHSFIDKRPNRKIDPKYLEYDSQLQEAGL